MEQHYGWKNYTIKMVTMLNSISSTLDAGKICLFHRRKISKDGSPFTPFSLTMWLALPHLPLKYIPRMPQYNFSPTSHPNMKWLSQFPTDLITAVPHILTGNQWLWYNDNNSKTPAHNQSLPWWLGPYPCQMPLLPKPYTAMKTGHCLEISICNSWMQLSLLHIFAIKHHLMEVGLMYLTYP